MLHNSRNDPPRGAWRSLAASTLLAAALTTMATTLFATPRPPCLRLFVAPAWMAGVLIGGAVGEPNRAAFSGVLFVLVFAACYIGTRALTSRYRFENTGRLIAWNLLALFSVLAIEVAFHRQVARFLYESVGGTGDVGSEFTVYFALRVVPGALLFAAIATATLLLANRYRADLMAAALFAVWLVNLLLLLWSVSRYFCPYETA